MSQSKLEKLLNELEIPIMINGKYRSIVEVFQDLSDNWDKLSQEEKDEYTECFK